MKNFVKLIKQVHKERFSVVMNRILTRKLPVAFLFVAPIDQAVDTAKDFREQDLNITTLIVVDTTPPPANLDFEVIHVSKAAQIYPQPEYVFAVDNISARVAIKNLPASKVLSLNRGGTEHIYQAFMTHLDDLQEVYESLIDEESKKTFRGYWLGCTSNQLAKIVHSNSPHHLINGFIPERGAIIIEAGTYDGGTATILSEMGYKVYSFEMDRLNYERSLKVAEEKNFVVENLGLGSYKHTAFYNVTGRCDNKLNVNGANAVQVTTIDAYARENNLPSVDFIKLDVEGAELDVLKGAKTSIARFKTVLVLSAYHKLDDLWTFMNFIKSVRPDYEFALRQSYDSIEDTPSNYEENEIDYLVSLGLEPYRCSYKEFILFAR